MQGTERTLQALKEMQNLPLARKIQITQARIIEWYQKNEGKVYVSFSGGKDSRVLLHLVRQIYPEVPAVFADTGLEYPEIRQFVKSFDNVVWVKPEMNFREVIDKYGYPLISKDVAKVIQRSRKGQNWATKALNGKNADGSASSFKQRFVKYGYLIDTNIKISDECCSVMKKKPIHRYEKETGRKPFIATMACESFIRQKSWLQSGCNAFNAKRPTSQPMSFWTEQDVLGYIKLYNLDYASVYGDIVEINGKLKTTGRDRTGCVFCGFGCHLEKSPNRFQRLQKTHPQLWQYCMKPWEEGGLGMREPLEYIGVKVDNEEENQMNIFDFVEK